MDIRTWLVENLSLNVKWKGINWPTLFSTICWWLWRWRNIKVFNDDDGEGRDKLNFIIIQAKDYSGALTNIGSGCHNVYQEKLIKWKPPEEYWVKLNTDGMSKGNPGLAATGSLLRDFQGNWICGFMCNLGICTSVLAELWGLYYGLEMAWKQGYRRVEVELDSMVVVRLVSNGDPVTHRYFWLIEGCRTLLKYDWEVRIQHQFREGNCAADWLANFAGSLTMGHHEFDVLPAGLHDLFAADITGTCATRERV